MLQKFLWKWDITDGAYEFRSTGYLKQSVCWAQRFGSLAEQQPGSSSRCSSHQGRDVLVGTESNTGCGATTASGRRKENNVSTRPFHPHPWEPKGTFESSHGGRLRGMGQQLSHYWEEQVRQKESP